MGARPSVVRQFLIASALAVACIGCGAESATAPGEGGTGGASEATEAFVLPGLGFVASSFGFYYPADAEAGVPGFDLDGRVSTSAAPQTGECAHDDFTSPDQAPGIDYNFYRIISNEETREDGKYVFGGFREGQIVDGVISGATKNGSMTILVQIQGLDDPLNDDEVVVQVYASEDSPALGTDNSMLPGATFGVHPERRFHSGEVPGSVNGGVLTAGPIDLRFPIDIMIVQDEMLIHDSWIRVELGDGRFEGTVSGYWDVSNIRDIIGVPTTDNGNAANFTIEQFEAAMAELADGDYDADSGLCMSFSTMFRFSGLQAFLVSESVQSGTGGTAGSGGGNVSTPIDQCVNDADQAALAALETDEQSGPAVVGSIAGDCPLSACTAELGSVLSDGSEAARNALGDCIAACISVQTSLSMQCTSCYGTIAACSTAFCVEPCLPPNSGSEECANCALENCIDVNACTGLY